jgi:hypothetical protein
MPTESLYFVAYTSDEFDLTCTGDHVVFDFDAPGSTSFVHLLGAEIEITDKAGTVVIPAQISIGDNASSYNNYVSAQSVGGSLSDLAKLQIAATTKPIPKADGEAHVKVVSAASGIGLTLKAKVTLFGFLGS